MSSVPFDLPDINGGLTEIKGLIFLDDEFLVIEFETAFLGEFGKEQKTVKIEPAAISQIHLDQGFIRDIISIRPKKTDLLDAIPGSHLGELRLKVWRNRRPLAARLVRDVQATMNRA
ncbi:MAG: hypothetical protein HKN43_03175 [Rhodothermales bacterium]|nr:hypothetical protein [Rhodothermales bacterium]